MNPFFISRYTLLGYSLYHGGSTSNLNNESKINWMAFNILISLFRWIVKNMKISVEYKLCCCCDVILKYILIIMYTQYIPSYHHGDNNYYDIVSNNYIVWYNVIIIMLLYKEWARFARSYPNLTPTSAHAYNCTLTVSDKPWRWEL